MFRVSLSLLVPKGPWEYTYLPVIAFVSLEVFLWLLKSKSSQDHLTTHNSLLWFHDMYAFRAAIKNIGATDGHTLTGRNLDACFGGTSWMSMMRRWYLSISPFPQRAASKSRAPSLYFFPKNSLVSRGFEEFWQRIS